MGVRYQRHGIDIACPRCGATITVIAHRSGTIMSCRHCKQRFRIKGDDVDAVINKINGEIARLTEQINRNK